MLDANNNPVFEADGVTPKIHPDAGKDWGFAYGEREWLSGVSWEDAKDYTERYVLGRPKDKTENYRSECN